MLSPAHSSQGVTLIELVIGMAILAGMLALAAPSMSVWMQNRQIRSAAMALLNGLQLTRATAVERNSVVMLSLTTSLDNGCAASVNGPHWVISQDDPTALCAATPDEKVAPRIVQRRSANEGTKNIHLDADLSSFRFNGQGRFMDAGTSAVKIINVSHEAGGACVADGGQMRCLRVVASAAGQIRLCDPAAGVNDVRRC